MGVVIISDSLRLLISDRLPSIAEGMYYFDAVLTARSGVDMPLPFTNMD